MHFSEDDLRNALRRKDPGPAFTQKVMARVSQKEEVAADARSPKKLSAPGWTWRLRPALLGAVAAPVLLIVGGLGYRAYEYHQRQVAAQRLEEQKAREAEQKVILALRITHAKLNHIFKQVNESTTPEPKIRRQSL